MVSFIVYSRPGCQQCKATLRRLRRNHVSFIDVDAESTPGVRELLLSRGFKQLPVVVSTSGSWSGYRPDRIDYACGAVGGSLS